LEPTESNAKENQKMSHKTYQIYQGIVAKNGKERTNTITLYLRGTIRGLLASGAYEADVKLDKICKGLASLNSRYFYFYRYDNKKI
jgi:hypothetical protein